MAYWILKTEPEAYSFADLQNDQQTYWDEIRNYQARNYLLQMRPQDSAFIYHSGKEKAIVGMAQILEQAIPEDPTDPKPIWYKIKITPTHKASTTLPLSIMRTIPSLETLALFRQTRLSIIPVTQNQAHVLQEYIL